MPLGTWLSQKSQESSFTFSFSSFPCLIHPWGPGHGNGPMSTVPTCSANPATSFHLHSHHLKLSTMIWIQGFKKVFEIIQLVYFTPLKRVFVPLRNYFFPYEFIACLSKSAYKLQKGKASVWLHTKSRAAKSSNPELTPGGKWDSHVKLWSVTSVCHQYVSSVCLESASEVLPSIHLQQILSITIRLSAPPLLFFKWWVF